MIAACGLDCSTCPGYRCRTGTDPCLSRMVAADWSADLHRPIKPEEAYCNGCSWTGPGRLSPYCEACDIRQCVYTKGFSTCAECSAFAGCTILQAFAVDNPSAMATLQNLRLR